MILKGDKIKYTEATASCFSREEFFKNLFLKKRVNRLYRNILLAFDFAKRDFKQRYVGTGLGQFWYVLSPIIMIFLYTVIFSDFMKMNIVDNSYAYSIYIVPRLFS